jgi:hypothetical protein
VTVPGPERRGAAGAVSEKGEPVGILPGMSPVAVGKRLKCANCETEVIVVKGTDGEVECCGQPMEEREG